MVSSLKSRCSSPGHITHAARYALKRVEAGANSEVVIEELTERGLPHRKALAAVLGVKIALDEILVVDLPREITERLVIEGLSMRSAKHVARCVVSSFDRTLEWLVTAAFHDDPEHLVPRLATKHALSLRTARALVRMVSTVLQQAPWEDAAPEQHVMVLRLQRRGWPGHISRKLVEEVWDRVGWH